MEHYTRVENAQIDVFELSLKFVECVRDLIWHQKITLKQMNTVPVSQIAQLRSFRSKNNDLESELKQ